MSKDNLNYEDLLQIVEWVETASRFAEFHLKVGDMEIDLTRRVGAGPAPALQVAPAGLPQGGELSNGVVIDPKA